MRKLFPLLVLSLLLSSNAAVAEKAAVRGVNSERLMLAGDRPDPSIIRDGDTYYMVHSSFEYAPGLLIYRSKDLVRWEPLVNALHRYVGSVYAPDIVKHNGRWYIYFPVVTPAHTTNMVVWADSPEGPWSEPVDLQIGGIDPGHAVDAEGNRYLLMSNGYLVPLAADGLSATGPARKVYDGWEFPKEWDVEGFCLEGPKIRKIGKYYYMLTAEGGTAGPPTSHMVVVARAERLTGPWENSPYNPLVHTYSPDERWCSKGHGTLIDTPDGQWYVVYHAYERGFYTLGRQTLIEPVAMTEDGWPAAVARPAKKQPAKQETAASFSDDFSTDRTGTQWQFAGEYDPQRAETTRPTPVRCCSLPEIMPMKWRSKRNARRKQSPDWCSFTIRNFIPESAWTKDAWQSTCSAGPSRSTCSFPGTSGSGCGTTGTSSRSGTVPTDGIGRRQTKAAKPRAITTTWPGSS